jgi:hypothetical protein
VAQDVQPSRFEDLLGLLQDSRRSGAAAEQLRVAGAEAVPALVAFITERPDKKVAEARIIALRLLALTKSGARPLMQEAEFFTRRYTDAEEVELVRTLAEIAPYCPEDRDSIANMFGSLPAKTVFSLSRRMAERMAREAQRGLSRLQLTVKTDEQAVLQSFTVKDPWERELAAELVGVRRIRTDPAAKALRKAMAGEPHPPAEVGENSVSVDKEVRLAAARSWVSLGIDGAQENSLAMALILAFGEPWEKSRAAAQLGETKPVEELLTLFAEKDEVLVSAAAEALGSLGSEAKSAVEHLRRRREGASATLIDTIDRAIARMQGN